LIGLASAGVRADWPNRQSDTVEKLITEPDDRAAAWAATARLQEHPEAALTLLLRPGFVTTGPHGDWSPRMLALAELGAGAIPSIVSRIRAIGTAHAAGTDASELRALVMILVSFGPPAVPALLEIAALGESRWSIPCSSGDRRARTAVEYLCSGSRAMGVLEAGR
jgi:hypothetical protein